MADTEKKFSELETAGVFDGSEFAALSQTTNGQLMSVKATLQAIANWFAINSQYTSALQTTSKNLTGAINELKGLISLIPQFSIEVVVTLPTEDISDTTIYLVPSSNPETENAYDEFIHVNNTWEQVGTTAVDLSAYYTKLEVDGLLENKANTADVTTALALKENKSDMEDDVTDIVVGLTDTQTATGNPVTLTTVQEGGAKSALVTFTLAQEGSGDPSPTNIRPFVLWSSVSLKRTGTNVADFKQDYNLDSTTGLPQTFNGRVATTDPVDIIDGVDYIFLFADGCRGIYSVFNGNTLVRRVAETISGTTLDVSGGTKFYACVYGTYGESVTINSAQPRININTATNYEPYQGDTHTATFDEPVASGIYDFVSGKLKIIYALVNMGNLTYIYGAWGSASVFTASLSDSKTDFNAVCETFKQVTPTKIYRNEDDYAFCSNINYIRIIDSSYSDANTFKTAMSGHYLAYELATPQEITLTSQEIELLKGANVLWTDGDNVIINYAKLPQGNLGALVEYIQQLEARIKALEEA